MPSAALRCPPVEIPGPQRKQGFILLILLFSHLFGQQSRCNAESSILDDEFTEASAVAFVDEHCNAPLSCDEQLCCSLKYRWDWIHQFVWGDCASYEWLPSGTLFGIPLANQHEPRMFAKMVSSDGEFYFDNAIGAQIGLHRITRHDAPVRSSNCDSCIRDQFQVDVFAVVFSRMTGSWDMEANDFRAGIPITYQNGPWQAKLAYEHLSSHLGDEFIERTGATKILYSRDEIVLGLAYYAWDHVRMYGQAGFMFLPNNAIPGTGNLAEGERYNFGIELAEPVNTSCCGEPFAAVDVEMFTAHDYEPNTTIQVGWQWKEWGEYSFRIVAEYYRGRSPYGQFFTQDEDWLALGIHYDW